ncbi:MAG: C40 family peptidase [Kiritimatiellia bacterium]
MINEMIRAAALAQARAEYPSEACGLVIERPGGLDYIPCRNVSSSIRGQFVMAAEDYARAEDSGKVVAVVHSHCDLPPRPSQADLKGCEESGLPWYIVSVPSGAWESLRPSGYRAPLVGRDFAHGIFDCYSLIRDWYAQERGITLPDFPRVDEWWKAGQNLYMDNFRVAGFSRVDTLEIGDVIIMQIGSRVPNHAGVYIGPNLMLHHLRKKLSAREVYGGYWQKNTRMIVRHGVQ